MLKVSLQNTLDDALRQVRKSNQLTQPAVAKLGGVSLPTIRLVYPRISSTDVDGLCGKSVEEIHGTLFALVLPCPSPQASWYTRAFLEIGILVQDEH
jgi:hypothetical protein